MPYCQHCGGEIEHVPEVAETAIVSSDEVKIAEINRAADVEIARINAGVARHEHDAALAIADTVSEAQVDTAEVEAETVAELLANDAMPDAEPEPETIVVETPDTEPEPEPDFVPPEAIGSPVKESKSPGWWDAYR